MQLNGSAQGPGSEPQGIPLGPFPSAPFDDYSKTEREKFLSKLPLQRLDLPALFFIPDVERKGIHPIVRRKANRPEPAFKRLGESGLTRAWQAAHNNQSRSSARAFH